MPIKPKADPRRILEALAADPKTPPALRYRVVCKLLALDEKVAARTPVGPVNAAWTDDEAITARAAAIGAARRARSLN